MSSANEERERKKNPSLWSFHIILRTNDLESSKRNSLCRLCCELCTTSIDYSKLKPSRPEVSIIVHFELDTNRLFVELGHMLEYHLATAYCLASHSIVHSSPLHTYSDIFESATISFRIQKFPHPIVSILKSNLPVHTCPVSL